MPKPRQLLLVIVFLLFGILPACEDAGGGPGEGDDDTSVDLTLEDSYVHVAVYDIEPSAVGQQFGLSPCSITMNATLELAPEADPCDECEAVYRGPVTSHFTDCSSVEVGDNFTYGLARPATDELDVWSLSEAEWDLLGTASLLGGVWELSYVEEMGDETFSLGTMDSYLTFE